MTRGKLYKLGLIVFLVLFSVYAVLPTLLKVDPTAEGQPWYVRMLPNKQLKLGLDLKGGIHLVLGVDVEKAVDNEAERYASDIRDYLKQENIAFTRVEKQFEKPEIAITLTDIGAREKLMTFVETKFNIIELAHADDDALKYVFRVQKSRRKEIERDTIDQTLETLRNRIDEFGVTEPQISTQGQNRIIVQLPGLKDPERAKEVMGKTAQLEFKMVDESKDIPELHRLLERAKKAVKEASKLDREPSIAALNHHLQTQQMIPDGTEILLGEDRDGSTKETITTPYLLKSKVLLTGETLEDARMVYGGQFNEPVVSLRFSPRGADLFGKVTKANVKKRLAIILDGKVNSAPVIQEPILNGRAQISFNALQDRQQLLNEARDLSIVLRAGALPAPVDILENRAVGPTLGNDSVKQGKKSLLIGALLVIVFMLLYYRSAGVVADAMLTFNVLFIMAMLAAFSATLTLPGIAGIVLTIGMAVDANIIVFERIREELGLGKTPHLALESGFERAHLTVLDANVTTLIAGLVLLQYGTGPVKGFAVTLIIGIISSYVTAIWIARYFFDWLMRNERVAAKLFVPKGS